MGEIFSNDQSQWSVTTEKHNEIAINKLETSFPVIFIKLHFIS